ncbi:uncharacterized protein METZ01_LOCUS245140, partial [marine metagenome]
DDDRFYYIRENEMFDGDELLKPKDLDGIRKTIMEGLKGASKSMGTRGGVPDRMVIQRTRHDLVMIVELKGTQPNCHISDTLKELIEELDIESNRFSTIDWPIEEELEDIEREIYFNRVSHHAADGVLHYASFLKEKLNVIAVAFSRRGDNQQISHYMWVKNALAPHVLQREVSADKFEQITSFSDFDDLIRESERTPEMVWALQAGIKELEYGIRDMLDKAKFAPLQRSLFVGLVMSALRDQALNNRLGGIDGRRVTSSGQGNVRKAVSDALNNVDEELKKIFDSKTMGADGPWKVLLDGDNTGESTLFKVVNNMYDYLGTLRTDNASQGDFDRVQIFIESFSVPDPTMETASMIPSPRNLATLICKMLEIRKSDIVADISCGTGTFLQTSLDLMLGSDTEENDKIMTNQIIGRDKDAPMLSISRANLVSRFGTPGDLKLVTDSLEIEQLTNSDGE